MKKASILSVRWDALVVAAALVVPAGFRMQAYSRYNDTTGSTNGCSRCHGSFLDGTSPQGTVFPNNDKHRMHRSSAAKGTKRFYRVKYSP
jgi:hypothetical protein